ncbi:hypothetical protein CDO73_03415 [Saccharibacillus sp. O23]|uniref:hypothetical protein n=1 Tax=Saccharibacillus sp. O23 TaxID=2009338 RepID=UPI000B4E329C|nr:hypothetical protein [Saccharibacillus sp. O23]OWR32662.1 hypothetical protein CDO73_03415 [Saccharibacillus sp. O23]
MNKRGKPDSLSGIRSGPAGGVRALSHEESAHYASLALEHIASERPDIDPAELLPIRAVELDNDEMLLEYARHHAGIPLYRGPRLFIRMKASGGLQDLRTDWNACRFDAPPDEYGPPAAIRPPEDASCVRGTYALDVSGVLPFYLCPPRLFDRTGKQMPSGEKLGPWEWIDLRGGASAKRSASAPIRTLHGRIPAADSRRSEPLDREELRRARAASLDYLLRSAKPKAYRWAFLAGKERSSFRARGGGFVQIRVYRLVHGLPVLGACLDLYVERRSGRLAAASDELHFRRVRPERFAEAMAKPVLNPAEAWAKLRGQIRVMPYYVVTGTDAQGIAQAALMWIEESEFVCDASSGKLVRAEIVRV